MRRAVLILSIAAGAGALLGGCSGAGAPVQELRGGPTQAFAQDTLTAMALVSDWVTMLYTLRPEAVYETETILVDGVEFWVVYANYSTGARSVHRDNVGDRSWTEEITYPNGEVLQGSAGPFVENGNRTSQSGEWIYPGGQRRTWHKQTDFGVNPVVMTVTGNAITAGGLTMQYRWERLTKTQDVVSATLPDGTILSWQVRLTERNRPRRDRGVEGSLTTTAGEVTAFKLSGQGEEWDAFTVTGSEGRTGTFTLDSDMAGTGRLEANGELMGGLQWTGTMEGMLDLFGSGEVSVWPSSAARDFQINNWIRDAAELGPFPF